MDLLRRCTRATRDYARLTRDLAVAYRLSLPAKLAKVVYGRARYGVSPEISVGMGVIDLPPRRWRSFRHSGDRLAPPRIVNFERGEHLFRNKVALLERLAAHGLPHTESYGVDDLPRLGGTELFIKPADEYGGRGAFTARADEGGLAERARGLLIQRRLRSHPGLGPIGGGFGLPTLRVQTVLTREGGRVVDIVAKILTRPDLVDNWQGGRTGKLIAGVDLATGRLTRAYGLVPGTERVVRRVEHHPTTGVRLTGWPLPDFQRLIETGERLAEAFPDAPMLGSDIALTTEGPVVVEPNLQPEMNFPQITRSEGVLDFLPDWIAMADAAPDVKARALAALGSSSPGS